MLDAWRKSKIYINMSNLKLWQYIAIKNLSLHFKILRTIIIYPYSVHLLSHTFQKQKGTSERLKKE